ncbi:mitochondrial carrier domain-containing protein [Fennellomyces sp. T-0311]|nr:mitochondrial carrier domain-containing protein [Fennellomyces sp. T-0311]
MTLTAYLGLLSLGSSIQRRSSSDSFEREEQVLRLRRMDTALANAEIDVVNAVSQHSAPAEEKDARESAVAVSLTMGTMVANYILCFPIVVARHRLQAFPIPGRSDTPVAFARSLHRMYRKQGPASLYSGIGLGLLSQAVTGAYDSYAGRSNRYGLVPFLTKTCLGTGLFVLLYPFYRSALIVRVQASGTHKLIRGVKDFALSYTSNLARFFTARRENQLPMLSVFIPSCITQVLTERLLMFLYHRIYPLVSFRKTNAWSSRRSRSQQRQQQHHRRARRQTVEIPRVALESSLLADLDARVVATSSAKDRRREEGKPLRTFYPEMVSGIASSIIARTLIFPIDTVVYKLMLQDSGIQPIPTHYTGFFDCIRQTWDDGGWKAFFPAWGGLVVEIAVSYLVLEGSWMVYRLADWKLSKYPSQEPQSVRKARHLRERMNSVS